MIRLARIDIPALHPLGWGGLALWLVAVVVAGTVLLGELDARREAVQAPNDPGPAYLARANEIQALLENIPHAHAREALVADLLRAAQTSGLDVSGGRYREEALDDRMLRRIETTLPVGGSHMAILRWVYALTDAVPAAVLTRISVNRGDLKEPFSGDVRLDLLLRSSS
jgi:hypothetical protein